MGLGESISLPLNKQVWPSRRARGTARRRERGGIKPNETSNGEAPWGVLVVERGNKALIPGLYLHPPPLGTQGWRAIRERDKKRENESPFLKEWANRMCTHRCLLTHRYTELPSPEMR